MAARRACLLPRGWTLRSCSPVQACEPSLHALRAAAPVLPVWQGSGCSEKPPLGLKVPVAYESVGCECCTHPTASHHHTLQVQQRQGHAVQIHRALSGCSAAYRGCGLTYPIKIARCTTGYGSISSDLLQNCSLACIVDVWEARPWRAGGPSWREGQAPVSAVCA